MFKKLNEKGQLLILVFIALGVVLFTVLFVVGGSQVYFHNSQYSYQSEAAYYLAEAGIDKAIASLNKTGGSYNGESEVVLGSGSYSVVITSIDAATKQIESTGYIPNKVKPLAKRTIKTRSSRGVGASFLYGVQVGEGGIVMRSGNLVKGSIYSNGNVEVVESGDGNEVQGDIWVAGGASPVANIQTDCTGVNCTDFIFGKTVSGEDRFDVGQSFKPTVTDKLNKVSVKVKKINTPSDITARILADNEGKPDKNNVLATGTLYNSLVTGSYGWVDITFNTVPNLTSGLVYWLMFDTSSSSTNYWAWQNDLAQTYGCGSPDVCKPKWSPNWSANNPVWTGFNGDLNLKVYMGGIPTHVDGDDRLEVGGNVHANTIRDTEIAGDAYYQSLISSSVDGTSHPNSDDPPPKVFPISDANILDWKNQAEGDGSNTISSLSNCVTTLGPIKINGNVTLHQCSNITVKSPIWITGNLILKNGNIFKLSSEYGATSGVIIVDGKVEMENGNQFKGTGTDSSLLMVLSTFDSISSGQLAIDVKNNGNTGVFYAGRGIISPGNGNSFKELTAWKISLVQNSIIDYEQGLSSTLFSSGPSGSYSLVKGTYQFK